MTQSEELKLLEEANQELIIKITDVIVGKFGCNRIDTGSVFVEIRNWERVRDIVVRTLKSKKLEEYLSQFSNISDPDTVVWNRRMMPVRRVSKRDLFCIEKAKSINIRHIDCNSIADVAEGEANKEYPRYVYKERYKWGDKEICYVDMCAKILRLLYESKNILTWSRRIRREYFLNYLLRGNNILDNQLVLDDENNMEEI